jgi:Family of unknown function (DUF5678)
MPYESRSPAGRWIRSNWFDLGSYRFQWVASDGERVIAHGEDLDDVLAATLTDGRTLDGVAIAYVDGQEYEPGVGR